MTVDDHTWDEGRETVRRRRRMARISLAREDAKEEDFLNLVSVSSLRRSWAPSLCGHRLCSAAVVREWMEVERLGVEDRAFMGVEVSEFSVENAKGFLYNSALIHLLEKGGEVGYIKAGVVIGPWTVVNFTRRTIEGLEEDRAIEVLIGAGGVARELEECLWERFGRQASRNRCGP